MGWKLGWGQPTPLWTTVPFGGWGGENGHECSRSENPLFFDDQAVEGEGVAPLNVRALDVLAPCVVAFSRNALPPAIGARHPSVCVMKVLRGVFYLLLCSSYCLFVTPKSLGLADGRMYSLAHFPAPNNLPPRPVLSTGPAVFAILAWFGHHNGQ